jgi:outer membrane protein
MHNPFRPGSYLEEINMSFPRLSSAISRPALLLTVFAIFVCAQLPSSLRAQDAPSAPTPQTAPAPAPPQAVHLQDYSKPRSAFPHMLQAYRPQAVAQPSMGNSPRIDSLMRDGRIYLSIDDAVALTLENNLDLDIARYNLNIADTDYLRAKSGANILGVNAGIVQNTPGGGVGGLGGTVGSGTGGTTVAASGIGTGTNGLVSSTLGIG